MKKIICVLFVFALITGCSPKPEQLQPLVNQTLTALPTRTSYPTNTPFSTYTPMPTYTALPTYTKAPTLTPVIKVVTATPTIEPTPSPAPTNTPQPPSVFITDETKVRSIFENPTGQEGTNVKIIVWHSSADAWVNGKKDSLYNAVFVNTKSTVDVFLENSTNNNELLTDDELMYGWIIGNVIGIRDFKKGYFNVKSTAPVISVISFESYDESKHPKVEGLFAVGTDIAPGKWVSMSPMTEDGCYWARISQTGNIIDNHFGVAGITVYVSATDAVVEFNGGCGYMLYSEN